MELGNGSLAALITSVGWNALNLLVWPVLLVALVMLWAGRREVAQA